MKSATGSSAIPLQIVIVAHHENQQARLLSISAAAWLRERGHIAWMPSIDATALGLHDLANDRPPAEADLVLSLGGDGTMLRAVNLLAGSPVPLLGVNVGRLGYLTEVEIADLYSALERFTLGSAAGKWSFDERMMLDVAVVSSEGLETNSWLALNEAVVEKVESGHTVHLLLRIDGEAFTSYVADGLIVSTPTGSTAYSLSARGPVVSPKHKAVLVTPVAPHMLFDRTLVLDPTETVEIELLGDRPAMLAIDGRSAGVLSIGSAVRCKPSDHTARFIRFESHHFHQVLKAKFGLADR